MDQPADDKPSPIEAADDPPRVTRDELRDFLGRKDVLRRATGIVKAHGKGQEAGDLVNTAVVNAMASPVMPRRASMQAWFDRICRNTVTTKHRSDADRKKYQGPMPVAPALLDEAGEPIDDPGDAIVDIDPCTNPDAEDPHLEGILLRRFLRDATASDPHERETFAVMEEWSEDEDERSLAEIATAHGISEDAAYKRVERLRTKYEPRYRRWRNGMFLLAFLGGALVIVVAVLVWRLRSDDIKPDPDFNPPRPPPSASASAGPPDTPFEPAQPTTPDGLKPGGKPRGK